MYATSGSLVANSLSYLMGPEAAWMTSNKPLILLLKKPPLINLANQSGKQH